MTAAFATGTGTLGGTLTANTVAGVATFTNLSISGAAGAYTLRLHLGRADGGHEQHHHPRRRRRRPGSRWWSSRRPPRRTRVAFAQQPTVQVQDAAGNPVAGVVSVTATILTGGGTLGGTATVNTNAARPCDLHRTCRSPAPSAPAR